MTGTEQHQDQNRSGSGHEQDSIRTRIGLKVNRNRTAVKTRIGQEVDRNRTVRIGQEVDKHRTVSDLGRKWKEQDSTRTGIGQEVDRNSTGYGPE